MAFHVLEQVRKTTRGEWNAIVKEKWTAARIWIQENGEAGFILGLASGLIVVILHKLFLALVALAVISGFGVYLLAPEEGDSESEGEKSSSANGVAQSEPSSSTTESSSAGSTNGHRDNA